LFNSNFDLLSEAIGIPGNPYCKNKCGVGTGPGLPEATDVLGFKSAAATISTILCWWSSDDRNFTRCSIPRLKKEDFKKSTIS